MNLLWYEPWCRIENLTEIEESSSYVSILGLSEPSSSSSITYTPTTTSTVTYPYYSNASQERNYKFKFENGDEMEVKEEKMQQLARHLSLEKGIINRERFDDILMVMEI